MYKRSILLSLSVALMVALLLPTFGLSADKPVKIGITQLVSHPALNAVRNGVIDEVVAAGYKQGEDVTFSVKSAQAQMSTATSIAQTFKAENMDVVVSIATNTSTATAQVIKDIPIVVAAVTDFVEAKLVDSYEDYENPSDNGNITGISDQVPNPEQWVRDQFELIKELDPSIDTVANIYNPGEANSAFLTKKATKVTEDMDLKLIKVTATKTAEVSQAAQSIRGRADAIWVSTDNTVVSALPVVAGVAKDEEIPLLVADPTSITKGPLIGYGFDYYLHGRMAGEIVLRVLNGEKPNEIPIHTMDYEDLSLALSAETQHAINIDIPQSIIDKTDLLYYGEHIWEQR